MKRKKAVLSGTKEPFATVGTRDGIIINALLCESLTRKMEEIAMVQQVTYLLSKATITFVYSVTFVHIRFHE